MNSLDELVREFEATVKEDMKKRQKSIEEGETLDKAIHQRMDAGEIGISLGTDIHVGVIMAGLAIIVTLFSLYIIFGVSPGHYLG